MTELEKLKQELKKALKTLELVVKHVDHALLALEREEQERA